MRYLMFFIFFVSCVFSLTTALLADAQSECGIEGSLCISSNGVTQDQTYDFPTSYPKLTFIGGDSNNKLEYSYLNTTLRFNQGSIFTIKNSIKLDFKNSRIFQNSSNNQLTILNEQSSSANVDLNISNGSNVSFGTIKANNDDKTINFTMSIQDSIANIDQIDFFSKNKYVKINITNKEVGDAKNTLIINGKDKDFSGTSRKVSLLGNFQSFNATNANITIGGDIIGSITSLTLTGSKLLFKDGADYKLGGLFFGDSPSFDRNQGGLNTSLSLSKESIFKMEKGEITWKVSTSTITGNSEFIADSIYFNSAIGTFNMTLGLEKSQDDTSKFKANLLKFNKSSTPLITFNVKVSQKSSFIVDKLDLSEVEWGNSNDTVDKSYFQVQVAKDAKFYVKELIIGPEKFVSNKSYGSYFKFPASTLEFKKITFMQNNFFRIINENQEQASILKVEDIDFTSNTDATKGAGNTTGEVLIDFKYNTLEVKNFTIKSVSTTNIKLQQSEIKADIFKSLGTGFKITGDGFSSFEANTLTTVDSDTTGAGTIIDNMKNFIVKNRLTASGKFTVQNNSIVNISNWEGREVYINITGNSTLNLNSNNSSLMLKETGTPINIDQGSTLNIFANKAFNTDMNKNNIKAINRGVLEIRGSDNTFNQIDNEGGIFRIRFADSSSLKNTGVIKKLFNRNIEDRRGKVELYDKAYVEDIENSGDLNVFGQVKIDKFKQQDQDANNKAYLIFNILKSDNTTTLTLKETPDWNKRIKLNLLDTSILLPGSKNRFDLLVSKGQSMTEGELQNNELFTYIPAWLKTNRGIEKKDGTETVWVNIERLTNFESLIESSTGIQKSARSIAKKIDEIVQEDKVTENIQGLINALDKNSKSDACTINEKDKISEYIYKAANAETLAAKQEAINSLKASKCLDKLAANMNKLSPINNSIFTNILHNEASKVLSMISNETKMYNGLGDYYVWTNNNFSYNSLANNNEISGYSGFSNLLEIGITGSFREGINMTGALGFTLSNLKSNEKNYDSNLFGANIALAVGYITRSYYVTLNTTYLLGFFNNKRYIDFLDNGNVATSSANIHSLAIKAEVGTEYDISKSVSINPNTFVTLTTVIGSGFKEKDSSASLEHKWFATMIPEFGVNVDATYEKLISRFFAIDNVFFKTNLSLGVSGLYRPAINTSFNFVGTNTSPIKITSDSLFSFGLQGGISTSLYKGNHEFNIYVNTKIGTKLYNNYSLGLIYRYSF